MSKPFDGVVNIDIKESVPDWGPYTQPAPAGAPNVLYVVLDDVGFAAMEPYGGLIETPNVQRIADRGLPYTNFHTTALCSPTRSCLLTGRNHTTNGMAWITEATTGFPNANGHIPFECAKLAEVLGELGWNTYHVGKWHLCAEDEMNLASSKRQWPLGRGFERYYGFLGGETNQWYPDLVYDNHPASRPSRPKRVTTSPSTSPTRRSSSSRTPRRSPRTSRSSSTTAPAPLTPPTTCPRSGRTGTRASSTWATRRYREHVLERQKATGHRPRAAPSYRRSTPTRTRRAPTASRGQSSTRSGRGTRSRDDEKRLFARMAEVYAGFLSHADHELGRLLDYLERPGQLDNTIIVVVSDNGSSGEGGPNGSVNENKFFNGLPRQHRGEPQATRRAGQPADLQPLPHRVGMGLQHAVQDVEAVRQPTRAGPQTR